MRDAYKLEAQASAFRRISNYDVLACAFEIAMSTKAGVDWSP